jgi:DHA1 family tetracycline resistance protein-like MFS transporter
VASPAWSSADNSSILAVAGLIGPFLYTQSFAYFAVPGRIPHLPGAPYLIAAVLLAAALAGSTAVGRECAPIAA